MDYNKILDVFAQKHFTPDIKMQAAKFIEVWLTGFMQNVNIGSCKTSITINKIEPYHLYVLYDLIQQGFSIRLWDANSKLIATVNEFTTSLFRFMGMWRETLEVELSLFPFVHIDHQTGFYYNL